MSNKRYGQTEFGEVHVLPELAINMSEGRALPPGLGQTEMPVTVLPAWEIDMSQAAGLKLTIQVRPGATPVSIAADLVAVYQRLNADEIRLGGKGLSPTDAQPTASSQDAMLQWVLYASDPSGAAERLGKLVGTVNGSAQSRLPRRSSFVSYVVELTNAS